jgi:hypothetical protein
VDDGANSRARLLTTLTGTARRRRDLPSTYVLADVLRTDRARPRPLTQDSDATVTLRMTVRARQDLVRAGIAMANQLRAHRQTTLPGVIGLFRDTGLLMPRSAPPEHASPRRLTDAHRNARICRCAVDVLTASRLARGRSRQCHSAVTHTLDRGRIGQPGRLRRKELGHRSE